MSAITYGCHCVTHRKSL